MNYDDKDIDFILFGGGITSDVLSLILKNENKQFYILDDNKNDKLINSPRSLALSPSSMNLLNYLINHLTRYLGLDQIYYSSGLIL